MVELLPKTKNILVIENVKICVESKNREDEGENCSEGLVSKDFVMLLSENIDMYFETMIDESRLNALLSEERSPEPCNFVERAFINWNSFC